METRDLSRREFASLSGAGLFVFFHTAVVRGQEPARIPGRVATPTDFNAFLKIGGDSRVQCLVGKVELGQGAMTSLAQVLAEELDVALDSVDVVMGDTDLCPYDMGTFGSMTTPLLVPVVRRAGAEARAVLLAMAAERLGAPVERLRVKNAVVADRTVSADGWQGGNPPGMHPFSVGPWRAPSVNSNTFGRESHIDVMAAKGGFDPLEFRLSNLTDVRMRRVLEAAATQFGWKAAKAPSGRGVGVACGIYANSCNATMAEVAVDQDGRVQVKRIVMALDVGVVLNPDGLRQQAEGSVMMGLGYALSEEVRFQGGKVLTRNYDDYQIPRFASLPKIEIVLVDNPQMAALGGGEPPIIAMGAVLANAIYDAAGRRLLELPMTPSRVKAGLA